MNQSLSKYSVLITDPVDDILISGLENNGLTVTYIPDADSNKVRDIIGEFDAIVVRSRTKLTADILSNTGKLKVVARAGIGLDTIDVEVLKKKGIEIRYAPGESTQSVAELALGLMISGARNVYSLATRLKKGTFKKEKGRELSGSTLGIVGFGRIGFRFAELAKAMGMKIKAYDIYKNPDLISKVNGEYVDLKDLLSDSDVVALFVTTKKGEKPVIGDEQLSMMKKGSMLINTSRAAAVDGEALLLHIENGDLGFYGADVLWNEPPTADWELKLLSHDSVLITPHIGAQTPESQKRIAVRTVNEITKFMEELK